MHSKHTALVPEKGTAKMGTLVVTDDQVLFFDQKFADNAGLGLAGLIGSALQKRHEDGGRHHQRALRPRTGLAPRLHAEPDEERDRGDRAVPEPGGLVQPRL